MRASFWRFAFLTNISTKLNDLRLLFLQFEITSLVLAYHYSYEFFFLSGTLGTLFQVFLTIGILIDYCLAKTNSYTAVCYTLTAITIAFFGALFFIPESPQHLMKKNRKSEAESALRRLRGPSYDVNAELNDLRKRNESGAKQEISFNAIFSRANVMALVISIGVMVNTNIRLIHSHYRLLETKGHTSKIFPARR